MDFAEKYVKRLNNRGNSFGEAYQNQAKLVHRRMILNSPSKQEVIINDNTEKSICIVHDKSTFKLRQFSFMPDTDVNIGDYIHYNEHTYLATKQNDNDIIPYLIAELCNEIFPFTIAGTRYIAGYDSFGKPKYKYTDPITHNIPCVLSTKIYSTVDNSSIPLPDGSIMIKIPYDKDKLPTTNYEFQYKGNPYKVTTFDYDDVINEKGFIEMRLQRVTGGDST